MWQFIISGYVPGTDVQIDFTMVATIALCLLSLVLLRMFIKRRTQLNRDVKEILQRLETIREISL